MRMPAHAGLTPRPLSFRPAESSLAAAVRAVAGADLVERADRASGTGVDYLRLRIGPQRHFGKLLRERGRHVEAARLAAAAAAAGLPALALSAEPLEMPDGALLVLTPWVEGHFFRGTTAEMVSLGRALRRLHAWLRSAPGLPPGSPAVDADWHLVAGLEQAPLTAAAVKALHGVLARRAHVRATLSQASQPLHDDLHPGNLLFDPQGEVLAVLDFEEALRARGSPWLDVAWVVERFALAGPQSQEADALIDAFHEGYGVLARPAEGVLRDALLWRNLRTMGLMFRDFDLSRPHAAAEWAKFCALIEAVEAVQERWREVERRFD